MVEATSILVMGPAGCGKTTVGQAVAQRLGWTFVDADAYHPAANRAKMARGQALTDADRWPWLERLAAVVVEHEGAGDGVVMACSALKRAYREALGFRGLYRQVVELRAASDVLRERLSQRPGHFVGPELCDSQLAILEPADEGVVVDADASVETVTDRVLIRVGAARPSRH